MGAIRAWDYGYGKGNAIGRCNWGCGFGSGIGLGNWVTRHWQLAAFDDSCELCRHSATSAPLPIAFSGQFAPRHRAPVLGYLRLSSIVIYVLGISGIGNSTRASGHGLTADLRSLHFRPSVLRDPGKGRTRCSSDTDPHPWATESGDRASCTWCTGRATVIVTVTLAPLAWEGNSQGPQARVRDLSPGSGTGAGRAVHASARAGAATRNRHCRTVTGYALRHGTVGPSRAATPELLGPLVTSLRTLCTLALRCERTRALALVDCALVLGPGSVPCHATLGHVLAPPTLGSSQLL